MRIRVFQEKSALGAAAADEAIDLIRQAIADRGRARILVATGQSQFEFLAALSDAAGVDWRAVELFHLDEYVGLGVEHPASFRRYLFDRLITKTRIARYHLLDGTQDSERICREIGAELARSTIDVAFAGIGENGHLAFNDPPADFQLERPYLVVRLDEACRRQQVGEGWFSNIGEVPEQAITISVRQLLKAAAIITVVPDARKAEAVKRAVEGPISPMTPASILQTHPRVTLYLDRPSARLLRAPPAVE